MNTNNPSIRIDSDSDDNSDSDSDIEWKSLHDGEYEPDTKPVKKEIDLDSKNDINQVTVKRKIKDEPGTSRQDPWRPRAWYKRRCRRPRPRGISLLAVDGNECTMRVTNFPPHWSYSQIYDFISEESLGNEEMEMEPDGIQNKPELRLKFTSMRHWYKALKRLQDKEVEGNRLHVEIEGSNDKSGNDSGSDTTVVIAASRPDVDAWQTDSEGLYGLKPEFLDRLKIKPPIGHWVHVSNFRCDKSELRDVLELAGRVVVCSVISVAHKYAKVMYSHPLEAVQAVSMLNNQVLYGKALSVVIDVCKQENILPKGLSGIGPGLAENGEAVRDMPREYERFLNGKSTSINLSLFKAGNISEIIFPPNNMATPLQNDAASSSSSQNSLAMSSSSNTHKNNITVITQNATSIVPFRKRFEQTSPNVQPSASLHQFMTEMPSGSNVRMPVTPNPMLRQEAPMLMARKDLFTPRPFPPNVMSLPGSNPLAPGPSRPALPVQQPLQNLAMRPNWHSPVPGLPTLPEMYRGPDPVTLTITNLPPTTSFPSLSGKLSALAQVTSLEFTTPGCAVVRFASPGEAEKCFQNYRSIQLS